MKSNIKIMKSKFKLFALSLLTLFVLSSVTESDAQTRKVKSSKKVAVAKANKRVSSTSVQNSEEKSSIRS